jgi:hypothetical protein
MKREKGHTTIGRRDFLRAATLGAGAAGVAAITVGGAPVQAAVPDSAKQPDGGYRETEHVKRYYELARR